MKLSIMAILISCLLTIACEKRKYPAEKIKHQEEDMYFNGSAGEEPVYLTIGADGYYCYSSFLQRPDSIYVFTGELRKYDCNPCPLALRVELSDYRRRPPAAAVVVDSAFSKGDRKFIPAFEKVQTLSFVPHSNKEISSVVWKTSNGTTSQEQQMSEEFGQPGAQTVSLTVRTKGNCESMIVNRIFVSGTGNLFACTIASGSIQNNVSQFTAGIIGGKPPYTYLWNFGDGSTSTLAITTHTYLYSGSYPVKLQVRDADNNLCESNYIHVSGSDKSSCALNMSLTHTGTMNAFLNRVKIRWTDRSGVSFTSHNIAQPAESYFEILNSQEYAPNERGERGRLLNLRFKVLLSDGSRQLWFRSESAAIAVSYK